ncbi:hypothetical protein J0910_18990 [Nocardiopsis sp. CNT-189]|uniref:hypothetical protein n=1 Tax=Nocardiopsis oceanisediminis TaxID=2816862 RepID=UPI003B2E425E
MIAIEIGIAAGALLLSFALASHAAMHLFAARKGHPVRGGMSRPLRWAREGARIMAAGRAVEEKALVVEARRRVLNRAVTDAARLPRAAADGSEGAGEKEAAEELRERLAPVDPGAVPEAAPEEREAVRSGAGAPDDRAGRGARLVPLLLSGAAAAVLCSSSVAIAVSQAG